MYRCKKDATNTSLKELNAEVYATLGSIMLNLRHHLFFLLLLISSVTTGHGLVHEQIDEVSTLLEQNPSDADLFIRRGRLYIEDERPRLAIKDFKRALKIDKNALDAYYYLGDVALRRGKNSKAIKYANTYLNKLPAESSARMRGYHLRGLAYIGANLYHQAAESLSLTIAEATHPKPEYYLDLAKCYVHLNQPDTAIAALKSGIKKRGELPMFYDSIIEIHLAQKQYTDALIHIDKLIATGQRLPFLYLRKADILLLQNKTQDAHDSLQLALNQINSLPEARRQSPAMKELQKEIEKKLIVVRKSAASSGK